jgi:Domain of unknown function (DUF4190)
MSRSESAIRQAPRPAAPATQRFSAMAIWSLVLSIITLGGLGSIAGIWLGVVARRRIGVTGERGAALAVAGIVVGIITLVFAIGYWVFIAMHVGGGGGSGGGGGGGGGGY